MRNQPANQPRAAPTRPARIMVALLCAALAAAICYGYSVTFRPNGGDIEPPLCMGRALLRGEAPYDVCRGFQSDGVTPSTLNPMTTVLFILPLLPFDKITAATIFMAISTGLLAYGLTQRGYSQLLVLLAFPYWQALQVVQWSPLLMAAGLLPGLLFVTLAKPHVGAPVALTRLTRWRALACVLVLALSLLLDPLWPLHMSQRVGAPGDYQIPLLIIPLGPLLALAALRWRSLRGRYLLLLSLVPQRAFYDVFLLWLVPQSRREIMILVVLSWLCYFGWYLVPAGGNHWIVGLLYLPALIMVLRDPKQAPLVLPTTPEGHHSQAT